jgi:hypothetical protein
MDRPRQICLPVPWVNRGPIGRYSHIVLFCYTLFCSAGGTLGRSYYVHLPRMVCI